MYTLGYIVLLWPPPPKLLTTIFTTHTDFSVASLTNPTICIQRKQTSHYTQIHRLPFSCIPIDTLLCNNISRDKHYEMCVSPSMPSSVLLQNPLLNLKYTWLFAQLFSYFHDLPDGMTVCFSIFLLRTFPFNFSKNLFFAKVTALNADPSGRTV